MAIEPRSVLGDGAKSGMTRPTVVTVWTSSISPECQVIAAEFRQAVLLELQDRLLGQHSLSAVLGFPSREVDPAAPSGWSRAVRGCRTKIWPGASSNSSTTLLNYFEVRDDAIAWLLRAWAGPVCAKVTPRAITGFRQPRDNGGTMAEPPDTAEW